jgi:hypothetical protein
MSIYDKLEESRKQLDEMIHDRRFKKAVKAREKNAELQLALGKCRGKLQVSKTDLANIVRKQSISIREGERLGQDITIQEDMLWDAALGYLLIEDALFALKSISSSDSIAHAYDMLDAAMKQISDRGMKMKLPQSLKLGKHKERNAYGYKTTEASVKAKEEILEGIWQDLKATGDIEASLKNERSAALSGDRLKSIVDDRIKPTPEGNWKENMDDNLEKYGAILDQLEQEEGGSVNKPDVAAMDALMSLHPENK